jgi:uncharacterized protein (DUF302 family)
MDKLKQRYGFSTTLEDISYDSALEKVRNVLKEQGFGILSDI